MKHRKCCACGKTIGRMDFYVTRPQGRICGACVVENNVPVSGCAPFAERAFKGGRSGKVLVLRQALSGQAI